MTFDHDHISGLHARLVAGDRSASSELAVIIVPELTHRLGRKWPGQSSVESVHDAAVEVFVSYLRTPHRYDPAKSKLVSWLYMQAHGDLTNEYRSPKRAFHQRQVPLLSEGVEVDTLTRNAGLVASDEHPSHEDRSSVDRALSMLDNDGDRQLFGLLLDGDTSTASAAEALGIMDLPLRERRAAVKRSKDRIKVKVRRNLGSKHE